jgi:hypothetical protein
MNGSSSSFRVCWESPSSQANVSAQTPVWTSNPAVVRPRDTGREARKKAA